MMRRFTFFIIFIFLFASGCSSKPAKTTNEQPSADITVSAEAPPLPTPSMLTRQLANEQEAAFFTEFEFKKGSENLSEASKQKLQKLSKDALAKGKIEMIKVITWADQEYPATKRKKLSDDQVALAHNRNSEIRNYLKTVAPNEIIDRKIKLISMAVRPDYLAKLTASDEVRIKKSLESAGIATSEAPRKKDAKSRRAIVLIKMKELK